MKSFDPDELAEVVMEYCVHSACCLSHIKAAYEVLLAGYSCWLFDKSA